MIYFLYKKTHRKTGLNYLGYTSRDPYDYRGSGIQWSRHLRKHGNDVDTEIILECASKAEVKHWGMYYSELWNVVDSNKWANLKPENGDGGDMSMCDAYVMGIKNRILPPQKGIPKSDNHCKNMSKAKQGIKPPNFDKWARANKGKSYFNNGIEEKRFLPNEVIPGWQKGRLMLQCVCGRLVDQSNMKKYHKQCQEEHQ